MIILTDSYHSGPNFIESFMLMTFTIVSIIIKKKNTYYLLLFDISTAKKNQEKLKQTIKVLKNTY